ASMASSSAGASAGFGLSAAALPAPELRSFNTALHAAARGAQWRVAVAIFARLAEVARPSQHSCNTVLHALARAELWQSALQLLEQLQARGESVTVPGFSAIMGACKQRGLWRQALALLPHDADARAFAAAVSACDAGLQWQRAVALLEVMAKRELAPSVEALSAACSAC
ncbi:unnamed protein product, partial [Effrenium voratum]